MFHVLLHLLHLTPLCPASTDTIIALFPVLLILRHCHPLLFRLSFPCSCRFTKLKSGWHRLAVVTPMCGKILQSVWTCHKNIVLGLFPGRKFVLGLFLFLGRKSTMQLDVLLGAINQISEWICIDLMRSAKADIFLIFVHCVVCVCVCVCVFFGGGLFHWHMLSWVSFLVGLWTYF